jgi:hypothetical protein
LIIANANAPSLSAAGLPFLATTCSILSATPNSVISGTHGTILFTCTGNAAITVHRAGSAVPTFVLPQGYTTLSIVRHVSAAAMCKGGSELDSGKPVDFEKAGNFDYCAVYSGLHTSTLASFKVMWSANHAED